MEINDVPTVTKQPLNISKTAEEKIAQWFIAIFAIPGLWVETYYEILKSLEGKPGWKLGKDKYGNPIPRLNGKKVSISTNEFDADPTAFHNDRAVFRVTFYAINDTGDNWLWFIIEFRMDNAAWCYTEYATHEAGDISETVAEWFGFKSEVTLTWQDAYEKLCQMAEKKRNGVPEFITKEGDK